MSRRTSIVTALTEKLKGINGTGVYTSNIFNNAYPKLKFWDEVNDFPSIYVTTGPETREYLPAAFAWGFLTLSIKAYTKDGENGQEQLEDLLEDIETCINANGVLVYDTVNSLQTADILIQSIITDEGLLSPYAVGEVSIQVQYEVP
jgi:hypothetical protein